MMNSDVTASAPTMSTVRTQNDDLTLLKSNDESSYHLNVISFEDSRVENFHEVCSPSILMRKSRAAAAKSTTSAVGDESEIEERRGLFGETTRSKVAQYPIPPDDSQISSFIADLSTTHRLTKCVNKEQPLILVNDENNKSGDNLQLVHVKRRNSLRISSSSSSLSTASSLFRHHLEETIYTTSDSGEKKAGRSLLPPPPQQQQQQQQSHQQSFLVEIESKVLQKRLEFLDMTDSTINESKLECETKMKKPEFTGKPIENLLAPVTVSKSKEVTTKQIENIKEVATQTSFLVANDNESDQRCNKSSNKSKRLSLIQSTDSIQKRKLRQLLEVQRHEKKSKELEALATLERLKAESLRQKMLELEIDSSSVLNNSSLNLSELLASKLESLKPKLNETTKSDDLTIVSSVKGGDEESAAPPAVKKEKAATRVQAVTINTSAFKRPANNVVVVRENNLNKKEKPYQSRKSPKSIVLEEDERQRRQSDKIAANQHVFLEIGVVVNKPVSSMSLQEAFRTYKRDLIVRSQQRQRTIEERARRRREKAETEKRRAVEIRDEKLRAKMTTAAIKTRRLPTISAPAVVQTKRSFSVHEIKEITRKNYERLPEVRDKHNRENDKKLKQLNRIRSNIYKKAIQDHLFTRGPNFNLNYKALNN